MNERYQTMARPVDALAAAERLEPLLNAYVMLHGARAQEADREGPLRGVPLAVKDNIDEQGVVCSAGSGAYADRIAPRDAEVVARLRRAGAVIVGRTNMHELADGVTSDNPFYGPVNNPWRLGCHPGGSSGGSAAAVASGSVVAALGTDTGGSVRIPASLCGVVGFKPSRGTVPNDGVVPLSTTLDHVGPLARTVAECAAVWRTIANRAESGPAATRLGVLEGFAQEADPGVARLLEQALERLERSGCTLKPVKLEGISRGVRLLAAIYAPEAALYHEPALRSRPTTFGAEVRADLERGLGADPARREAALAEMEALARATATALDDLDAFVCPTTPHPARPHGSPDPHTYLSFTCPFNLTGQPAVSLPMGLVDGLPVGLQLVGRVGEDSAILGLAEAFERDLGFEVAPAIRC